MGTVRWARWVQWVQCGGYDGSIHWQSVCVGGFDLMMLELQQHVFEFLNNRSDKIRQKGSCT